MVSNQDIHWGINEELEHESSPPEGNLQEMSASLIVIT